MPIYAYKCESCGAAKDVLQKMSDPALSDCPVCGQPNFRKQLTAAGFQLKGSGWYATDFRGGATAPAAAGSSEAAPAASSDTPVAVPAVANASTASTASTDSTDSTGG